MEWPRISIRFGRKWTPADLDEAAARLALAGCQGWEERVAPDGGVEWTAYLPASAAAEAEMPHAEATIREALAAIADRSASPRSFALSSARLAEEDWMAGCRERFTPFAVSRRFAVAPPWFEGDWPFPGRERVLIYPAMAFGTGTHETTRLALQALEDEGCAGRAVLDVGTGSGILAIAAALLGARTVAALDIDAAALENARHNCRLNGVEDRVHLFCGGPGSLAASARFELIVANILYANLRPLLPTLTRALASGSVAQALRPRHGGVSRPSRLILGGFLDSELEMVKADLAAAGLAPLGWQMMGEWGSVIAKNAC